MSGSSNHPSFFHAHSNAGEEVHRIMLDVPIPSEDMLSLESSKTVTRVEDGVGPGGGECAFVGGLQSYNEDM